MLLLSPDTGSVFLIVENGTFHSKTDIKNNQQPLSKVF